MLVSSKYRFVFIHVPKTGGSSITAALAPYLDDPKPVDPSQKRGWQIKHHVGKMHATAAQSKIPEGFITFAVQREEEDWQGSLRYHWPDGDPWGKPQSWWWEGVEDLVLLRFGHHGDWYDFCEVVGLPEPWPRLPHLNEHPR